MDQRDRAFADLAVRLQLLSREQVASCAAQLASEPGKRMAELALELGLLTEDEAALIRAQEARLLERQRPAAPRIAAALVEERVQRSDPRSASSPKNRAVSDQEVKGRKRAGPRSWDAPAEPAQGQVYIPRSSGTPVARTTLQPTAVKAPTAARTVTPKAFSRPAPQPDFAEDTPTSRRTKPPKRESELPDTAPTPFDELPSRPQHTMLSASGAAGNTPIKRRTFDEPAPQASIPARPNSGGVDAFPLAEGDERALLSQPLPAVTASTPDPRAKDARSDTLIGPRPVPSPAAARLGGTLLQASGRASTSPTPTFTEQRPASTGPMLDSHLGKALVLAQQKGASDLHVHCGAPMMARIGGKLSPLSGTAPVTSEAATKAIAELMTDAQWSALSQHGELEFSCALGDVLRFRANVFRQQRGLDAVFRVIAKAPPSLEELGLPARLDRLIQSKSGLVVCTGPAGSGKSSTIAALAAVLAATRTAHILSLEDPPEHAFTGTRALFTQRRPATRTPSPAALLRTAMRENADVLLAGELRDRETIRLALRAAEAGQLVLATLATMSAAQTLTRIVHAFNPDEQGEARGMLADTLRAVISQRLVPTVKGDARVPALEVLTVTASVSGLIREDKTQQLAATMQAGRAAGMISLDDSLGELVKAGIVSSEAARRVANKKERFV